jgi:hypothetical protein
MIINCSIDVTKIDKSRIETKTKRDGTVAKYLKLTLMGTRNGEPDQYGNDGFVAQSTTKEERDQKIQGAILGNFKYANTRTSPPPPRRAAAPHQSAPAAPADDIDPPLEGDDVPF